MSDLVVEKDFELWEIDRLIPYENNPKKHPPKQIKVLAAAMRRTGFSTGNAIQVDKNGVIIAGHGRRLAAIELGLEAVPVIVRDDLSEAQVKEMRLTENEASSNEYDQALRALEIEGLLDDGVENLDEIFDARDLEFLTVDLDEMDFDELTDDLESEVAEQTSKTQTLMDEEDGKDFHVSKVLGFTQVNAPQQLALTRFKSLAESETSLKGAEALRVYIDSILGA